MKKYTDGERVIFATDKAYEVLYEKQGFKLVKEEKKTTQTRKTTTKKGDE